MAEDSFLGFVSSLGVFDVLVDAEVGHEVVFVGSLGWLDVVPFVCKVFLSPSQTIACLSNSTDSLIFTKIRHEIVHWVLIFSFNFRLLTAST